MNAWLLTWEGTEGPAVSDDEKIVTVLSGRMSSGTVELIADVLYTRYVWTASDLARFANKRKHREQQFRHIYSQPSRFFYGNNPCIYARIVNDLVVVRYEAKNIEQIRWIEPPYLRVEEPGQMPVEVEAATQKMLIRSLRPIDSDI